MLNFGVNAVILKGKRVLLTLRSDFPVWCLPGGAIEPRETLEEAAVRETQEETGANVVINRVVGIYSRPHFGQYSNHEIVLAGQQTGGELIPQDGEALEAAYFAFDHLPNDLLWWHRERIFDAVESPQTIMRMQDVRWPGNIQTKQEAVRLLKEGSLQIEEFVRHFCHNN